MADSRQFRKRDYEEIPGQTMIMTGIPSYTITDDGIVTVTGTQGYIPPSVTLQRAIPSYNDVPGSRQVANLDGIVQSGASQNPGQDTPVAGPSSASDYDSRLSTNPFDDFVIEGYEIVSYEPS